MCGIIGYVGQRECWPVLVEGLRRMEYRGYDSSGVAVVNGSLRVAKEPGKLHQLADAVACSPLPGKVGIAHTRWATHGVPNQVNAHPQTDCHGTIAVVHNGIIENADALRQMLRDRGHKFVSDTDTEVLAHLIEECWDDSLARSVTAALRFVVGTYGIAAVSDRDPRTIVAARLGSPLVVGIGDGEYFIASDPSAFLTQTKQVIYPGEGEIVVLTADGYRIRTFDDAPVDRAIEEITWELAQIEKGGYPHFMLKEIVEQPATVENACRGRLLDDDVRLDGLNLSGEDLTRFNRVALLACGTSWHAALYGEYVLEELTRLPVEVEYASEFRYRNPVVDSRTLVVVISQSGETADTLAALKEAKEKGAAVRGIVNVVGSSIARETDGGIYTHAGPEIGVASTKAFTAQITCLLLLAIRLGRLRGTLSANRAAELITALRQIPGQIQSVLETDEHIREIAALFADSANALCLGRGCNFPVALEAALKIKEISYIHAEGYPAAEMKHGPIALIDERMPVVFVCTRDGAHDKVVSNMAEVRTRGGRIIAVATLGDEGMLTRADHLIWVPETADLLVPLLAVVPLQLLAYHLAVLRGHNVDQPRNLAKSVTVE